MLGLIFAATIAALPAGSCAKADTGEIVVARELIAAANSPPLEAVTYATTSSDPPEVAHTSSRGVVYGAGCRVVFSQMFDQAMSSRFSRAALGQQSFLVLTAFYAGGSGCGYRHVVLKVNTEYPGGLIAMAPMDLSHSNMDGFYVGDLGARGLGLVMWEAVWARGESHYERHRYKLVIYRWREGRFVGPTIMTTKARFEPSPKAVAKRLGLGFDDMTDQKAFGIC